MRNTVLGRKQARIIMALAAELSVSEERALDLSCTTETYWEFSDRKYGLQLMNDGYIIGNALPNCMGEDCIRLHHSDFFVRF